MSSSSSSQTLTETLNSIAVKYNEDLKANFPDACEQAMVVAKDLCFYAAKNGKFEVEILYTTLPILAPYIHTREEEIFEFFRKKGFIVYKAMNENGIALSWKSEKQINQERIRPFGFDVDRNCIYNGPPCKHTVYTSTGSDVMSSDAIIAMYKDAGLAVPSHFNVKI